MDWKKMKKEELVKKCQEMSEELEKMREELEELKKRNEELEDYAKRLKAQYENFKREAAEEKKRIMKNANEYLISKILPVLDDFDRAMRNANGEDPFVSGVEKIYRKLLSTLESEGLAVIEPQEGDKFDPFEHEAFERVETEEHDEYTILEIVEKGYKFHGKVVKPAKVKVAVRPKG